MQFKTFTHLLFISLFFTSVSAQITITASNLPSIGSINNRIVINDLQGITADYGNGDVNEQYTFDGLEGSPIIQERYVSPGSVDTEGLFPTANLARVSKDNFYQELLVKNDAGIKVIGGISLNPINTSTSLLWEVNGDYFIRKTPMNYQDNYSQEVSISATVSSSFLPDSILNQFPIEVDSFRFKINISTESEVDGYGTIYVNNFKSVDVLRQQYYESTDPRIEVRSSIIPWIDVTDIVKQAFPQIAGFLKADTIYSYRFYSDASAFNVLEVETEASRTELSGVDYSEDALVTSLISTEDLSYGYDISVSPNPSNGKVTFDIKVKEPGDYKIRILNIIGYQLWSDEYFIYDKKSMKHDFSELRRGTYFYSLVSPDGKTLVTKRMLIVGA